MVPEDPAAAAAARTYPRRPIVGVSAVVLDSDDGTPAAGGARVLLIRRRFEPLAGRWSLPGGALEVGETLPEGLVREVREETGLDVDVGPVVDVFDRMTRDDDGRVRYHFVLIDYLCRPTGGTLEPGSDVSAAEWAAVADLPRYELTPKTLDVIERALAMDAAPRAR